jgi:hypothetical protein
MFVSYDLILRLFLLLRLESCYMRKDNLLEIKLEIFLLTRKRFLKVLNGFGSLILAGMLGEREGKF